jgi:hypothetical protein
MPNENELSVAEAAEHDDHLRKEGEDGEDRDEKMMDGECEYGVQEAKERCRTLSTVESSELNFSDLGEEKLRVRKLESLPAGEDEEVTPGSPGLEAEGDENPRRGLCTYVCHPFKATAVPRRFQSRLARLIRLSLVYAVLLFVVMVLILWCGKTYEQAQVRKGPDTLQFYETPKVCALQLYTETNSSTPGASGELIDTQTLDSVDEPFVLNRTSTDARNVTREIVAHCGSCGSCSNPNDIRVYDQTKNTLYRDSVRCAKRGILGGRNAVEQCFLSQVDLTPTCTDCWVDNVMCDLRKCIFTCFWHAVFNKGVHSKAEGSEALNDCTRCDEVRCGSQFITCAGANRRRTGILSDIERDVKTEVCHKVDPKNWWNDESIQMAWENQQVASEAQEVKHL